ncbi:MAG: histidine kinase, partial [Propionibacteriales bacterium]|nr:histidine kinase [Propionibacteriales bacterium]
TYGAFAVVNTGSVVLLWWHRPHPVIVFGATLLIFVGSSLALGHSGNGGLTLPLWFSVFAVAAYVPGRGGPAAVAAGWLLSVIVKCALVMARGQVITPPEIGLVALEVGFFYVASFTLGVGYRLQRQRAHEAAEHARLLAKHSRALNAEAVAKERNRLARDLHDLAAHDIMDALLSVRSMRITDDAPILAEVEQKTARALDNMRDVVRTLREDDHEGPVREPLAHAARHLIDSVVADRGLTVDAHISVPVPVDDAASSTTISVLTEALINADSHAAGSPVTVALDADSHTVRLTVTNPTAGSYGIDAKVRRRGAAVGESPARVHTTEGTGYGLIGAGERAALIGGTCEAAAAPNGDWVVSLQVPNSATSSASSAGDDDQGAGMIEEDS